MSATIFAREAAAALGVSVDSFERYVQAEALGARERRDAPVSRRRPDHLGARMPITQNDTDDAMEVTTVSGLILLSPNGTKYRVYVTDEGKIQVHGLDTYRRLKQ